MNLKYSIRKTHFLIIAIVLLLSKEGLYAVKKEHKVKQGDSLYRISQKYNVPVDELKRINQLKSNDLKLGQVILLEEKK